MTQSPIIKSSSCWNKVRASLSQRDRKQFCGFWDAMHQPKTKAPRSASSEATFVREGKVGEVLSTTLQCPPRPSDFNGNEVLAPSRGPTQAALGSGHLLHKCPSKVLLLNAELPLFLLLPVPWGSGQAGDTPGKLRV